MNHSFEEPTMGPGVFDTLSAPPGWNPWGAVNFNFRTIGGLNPAGTQLYAEPAPHGNNVGVAFMGPSVSNSPAGLEQMLTATLQSRTRYTLEVDVGNIANDPTPPHNNFEFTGFPGYRIELLAGTNLIAADHHSILPDDGYFLTSTIEVTTASCDTREGLNLMIRLINLDQSPGLEVNFDNVRLDATPWPLPFIRITNRVDGLIRIDFSGELSVSEDLEQWTPLNPQPISPWIFAPTGQQRRYFRTSE
ncbi:MAG: hypothetical protein AAF492_27260 [Verrucomicrobiota bacterium]